MSGEKGSHIAPGREGFWVPAGSESCRLSSESIGVVSSSGQHKALNSPVNRMLAGKRFYFLCANRNKLRIEGTEACSSYFTKDHKKGLFFLSHYI